jgi:DHA2 family multidrug resistance protein-like MFS transporter
MPPRASRREWIGLAVLALPCLLYSMDLEVLYLATPSIAADLQPTGAQMLWIIDIYGFLLAGSLITMGTLGDRIGRRRLLLCGASAFGLASVLAAFAPTAETLIAARALLGVAGATLAPSTLSLIRNMFLDPRQRTFAVSVWTTCFSIGAVLGPLVGGVLLEFFWWGSVFLIAVPIMVLILVIGPILLPEFRDDRPGRMDLLSAALSVVAVLAVIYGLKDVAADGLGLTAVASVTTGIVTGYLCLRRQRGLDDPLVDVDLLRDHAVTVALSVNGLGIFVIAGVFLFVAQYLQMVAGYSPLEAGLLTIPSAIALIVGSMTAPLIARFTKPAYGIAIGLGTATMGSAVLAMVDADEGVGPLVTGTVLLCLGLAPVVTLATDTIVSAAPPERAGSAASMSETSIELGGALGIAVLGSIGVAVYRTRLSDDLPADLPSDEGLMAQETLGGAVDVSASVAGAVGEQVLQAAQSAFTAGFVVVSVLCCLLMVALAIAAAAYLREVRVG